MRISIRTDTARLRREAREMLSEAAAIRAIYQSERRRRGKARMRQVVVVR